MSVAHSGPSVLLLASKLGLADIDNRNVLVLDHVKNAVLHGDGEEGNKVNQKNGPEYRNIEEREEGTQERYQKCANRSKPDVSTTNNHQG
jgi:hypothetical protein